MGVYDLIKRAFAEALTGVSEKDVQSLCIRANTLADLAMRAKYPDSVTAAVVAANVRIISRLTVLLGYPRRKCSIPRVEVIQWGDEGKPPNPPGETPVEARSECLLAKIAGPSIRTQLDIQ